MSPSSDVDRPVCPELIVVSTGDATTQGNSFSGFSLSFFTAIPGEARELGWNEGSGVGRRAGVIARVMRILRGVLSSARDSSDIATQWSTMTEMKTAQVSINVTHMAQLSYHQMCR